MNSFCKNILIALITAFIAMSASANSDTKFLGTVKEELMSLKENMKEYSVDKKDSYIHQISESFNKQKKFIETLGDSDRKKMQHRYDQLYHEFKSIEKEAESKKEKMYRDIIGKVFDFNDELEKLTK